MTKQIIRYIIILVLFFHIANQSYGSNKMQDSTIHDFIQIQTNEIFNQLIEIRRDFHKHPELSGKENETQKRLIKYLSNLGLDVIIEPDGYGVVGVLKGAKEGKNIAWRADMDALPDSSPDLADFRSINNGVKHACGHDAHMTIGLGIANVLKQNRDSLEGNFYFIFQPEEETFEGAKKMIDNNFISQFNIDEIYELHVIPMQVGGVLVKPSEMYAYQKKIKIELENILTNEEILVLEEKIRKILSRNFEDNDPSKITSLLIDSNLGLTNQNSIFRDYSILQEHFNTYTHGNRMYLEFQIYETDSTRLKDIVPIIEQVIRDMNHSSKLHSVNILREPPIVINNEILTKKSIDVLNRIYGNQLVAISYGQVPYSNDDFSYFQQSIPGVYFFLGASNFEKGVIAAIHAPIFQIDEECIRIGVSTFSSLLFERAKKENEELLNK